MMRPAMIRTAAPSIEQVIAVIGLVYEAALDARLETQALDGLRDLLGCAALQVATHDRHTGEVLALRTSADAAQQPAGLDYATEWGRHDPLPALSLQFPSGSVLRPHEHFDQAAYEGSDFYRGFVAPRGYRWTIAGTLHVTDATSTLVSGWRPAEAPPFDRRTADLLAELLPHLRRAAEIGQRTAPRRAAGIDVLRLVERLPTPALLADAEGRILLRNAAAEPVLADMPVQLTGGYLRFQARETQRAWHQALGATETPDRSQAVVVHLPPALSWSLYVMPWTTLTADGAPDAGWRLVSVEQHGGPSPRQLQAFAARARLTPSETEVLQSLVEGHSLREIADHRGRTLNTVRSQLSAILLKGGARTQRELVARVQATRLDGTTTGS